MMRVYRYWTNEVFEELSRIVTVSEVSAVSGRSSRYVRRLCECGVLPAVRAGGYVWLIYGPAVEEYFGVVMATRKD